MFNLTAMAAPEQYGRGERELKIWRFLRWGLALGLVGLMVEWVGRYVWGMGEMEQYAVWGGGGLVREYAWATHVYVALAMVGGVGAVSLALGKHWAGWPVGAVLGFVVGQAVLDRWVYGLETGWLAGLGGWEWAFWMLGVWKWIFCGGVIGAWIWRGKKAWGWGFWGGIFLGGLLLLEYHWCLQGLVPDLFETVI